MSALHARKKVRFAEESLENILQPKLGTDNSERLTLLPGPSTDGCQLSAVNDEGPIKSTDPDFAAAVRASHRKQIKDLKAGEQVDLSLPEDFSVAEEDDESIKFTEDGIPIEPFNMKAERWSGYFDADGNYLAYRDQEDTDAWLETIPVGPIDSLKIANSQTEDGDTDSRPLMDTQDRQHHKQRIIQRLERGETVLDALKRLGSHQAPLNPNGDSKAARFASMRSRLAGTVPEGNRQRFEALTEDAGQLLNAGDVNIYTMKREALIRSLRPCKSDLQPGSSACSPSHLAQGPRSQNPSSAQDPQPYDTMNMDTAQTQALLAADPSTDMFADCIQPSSEQSNETCRALPAENESQAAGGIRKDTMYICAHDKEGFEYDEGSGMYYNTSLGCYFDAKQQLYGDASSGEWFSFEDERKLVMQASWPSWTQN